MIVPEVLFENHCSKFRQIYSPVTPDVSAVAFPIHIFVVVLVKQLSVFRVGIVQEVCLSYRNPVKFWSVAKLSCQFLFHVIVDVRIFFLVREYCCREKTDIIEFVRIFFGDME